LPKGADLRHCWFAGTAGRKHLVHLRRRIGWRLDLADRFRHVRQRRRWLIDFAESTVGYHGHQAQKRNAYAKP
jgi:hypothetical protein